MRYACKKTQPVNKYIKNNDDDDRNLFMVVSINLLDLLFTASIF